MIAIDNDSYIVSDFLLVLFDSCGTPFVFLLCPIYFLVFPFSFPFVFNDFLSVPIGFLLIPYGFPFLSYWIPFLIPCWFLWVSFRFSLCFPCESFDFLLIPLDSFWFPFDAFGFPFGSYWKPLISFWFLLISYGYFWFPLRSRLIPLHLNSKNFFQIPAQIQVEFNSFV